ncbi:MAG: hypothetical protein GYB31_06470 [Bacteroidetes bacterium]|nr:hypothetical protein [Bacteroidota bacterium]
MDTEKKKRVLKIAFLLNGFLFLLGGVGLVQDGKWGMAVLQFLAAAFNIMMVLPLFKESVKTRLNVLILGMNVMVTASIAWDYHLSGANYIQYAWLTAAVMSLLALFVYLKKKKPPNPKDN